MGNLEKPSRKYDETLSVTEEYRESLPDIQNTAEHAIQGADVPVTQVGSSNFRLPIRVKGDSAEPRVVHASITGTVSLKAGDKGINMSRVMRTFYEFQDEVFTLELLETILDRFQVTLGEEVAHLQIHFPYPLVKSSLRSGLEGYQYYDIGFLGRIDGNGRFQKYLEMDYIYSSACPCSSSLVDHARERRNVYGIPHSQRSTARVTVEVAPGASLSIEELQEHCLRALKTETQVMVRREDEQAFAELNGAFQIFVEDAVRLLYKELDADPRICDFRIICSHLESLHSHDAVAAVSKGIPDGLAVEFPDFRSLVR
jgi:GTP cyclohydrolase I